MAFAIECTSMESPWTVLSCMGASLPMADPMEKCSTSKIQSFRRISFESTTSISPWRGPNGLRCLAGSYQESLPEDESLQHFLSPLSSVVICSAPLRRSCAFAKDPDLFALCCDPLPRHSGAQYAGACAAANVRSRCLQESHLRTEPRMSSRALIT